MDCLVYSGSCGSSSYNRIIFWVEKIELQSRYRQGIGRAYTYTHGEISFQGHQISVCSFPGGALSAIHHVLSCVQSLIMMCVHTYKIADYRKWMQDHHPKALDGMMIYTRTPQWHNIYSEGTHNQTLCVFRVESLSNINTRSVYVYMRGYNNIIIMSLVLIWCVCIVFYWSCTLAGVPDARERDLRDWNKPS